MRDRIGESFDGTISGVTGFGVFVALDEVYVEGLVHISELGSDYFHFDAASHQLMGERTGQRFRLGDRMRVKLVRVDLETTRSISCSEAELIRIRAIAARTERATRSSSSASTRSARGCGTRPEA